MSKAHMLVLGFLKEKPFHGYQIGQVVEQMNFPHGSGLTLQAIYKSIQSLQKSGRISGTETREGNNPPKTVYHLNSKGRLYLKQLIEGFLAKADSLDPDWWLALLFSRQMFSKEEFIGIINKRISGCKELQKRRSRSHSADKVELRKKLPFVHEYMIKLCKRHQRAELQTMQELLATVRTGAHDDFFI